MPDHRELAEKTIQYLEVGRAVLAAQGTLTKRQSDLIDKAIEPLLILARGDPPAPWGPFSLISNVRR